MREIKFRAWDGINLVYFPTWIGLVDSGRFWQARTNENYDAEMYPLMQFTGLKDKTGKEIYEGDIIEYTRSGYQSGNWKGIFEIRHHEHEPRFYAVLLKSADENCFSDWNLWPDTDYIVIGNIHENPELLKV